MFATAYLGSFIAITILYALNGVNFFFMTLPKPIDKRPSASTRRLGEIASQPAFIVAVLSAAVGYSIMVLLMTVSPLAMTKIAYPFTDIAFVIQWHVLGMFVPSFFTGHLINRYGARRIIVFGSLLMLACVLVDLHGYSVGHFGTALLLLGIGWNFMFVGGTSLLTETYLPEESFKAQSFNDFIIFSCAAFSSFGAGYLHYTIGWHRLNYAVIPLLIICLLAHLWLTIVNRRLVTESPTNI